LSSYAASEILFTTHVQGRAKDDGIVAGDVCAESGKLCISSFNTVVIYFNTKQRLVDYLMHALIIDENRVSKKNMDAIYAKILLFPMVQPYLDTLDHS
jgi:hypothetical protein